MCDGVLVGYVSSTRDNILRVSEVRGYWFSPPMYVYLSAFESEHQACMAHALHSQPCGTCKKGQKSTFLTRPLTNVSLSHTAAHNVSLSHTAAHKLCLGFSSADASIAKINSRNTAAIW